MDSSNFAYRVNVVNGISRNLNKLISLREIFEYFLVAFLCKHKWFLSFDILVDNFLEQRLPNRIVLL